MARLLITALPLALAVRRLDLTATEGEVAGKYAFEGGENEATCKACRAVMQHVKRRMDDPMYDEIGYFAKPRHGKGSKAEQAERLNRAARAQAVLDPGQCMEQMKKYDLAYVGGSNNFQYKDPNSAANYPIHMELNDWAKQELGLFCESLFEEKEDELTAAVMAAEDAGAKSLGDTICKDELDLCHPPPPPPPPPPPGKQKKLPKAEREKQGKAVFESMDGNSDGFVDRREIQGHMKQAQRDGKLAAGKKVKEEVDTFFQVDFDGDDKVTLTEYLTMWGIGNKKFKKIYDEKHYDTWEEYFKAKFEQIKSSVQQMAEAARKNAKKSPYTALAGVGGMSAALYIGGMVLRLW